MQKTVAVLIGLGITSTAMALAQPPGRPPSEPGRNEAGNVESFLSRLMSSDANKDGKLQRDEITDARLRPLIERADADKDGVITKDELTGLFANESAVLGAGRNGSGGPGGPGAGGPPPGGPGGPAGGPGGRAPGPMPGPGQILPPFLQDQLELTDAQRKQLDDLQKDVDGRLAKILTDAQRQQLREMRERGTRGPGFGGPFGGPPGGPGGQPPREGPGNRRPPNE